MEKYEWFLRPKLERINQNCNELMIVLRAAFGKIFRLFCNDIYISVGNVATSGDPLAQDGLILMALWENDSSTCENPSLDSFS